MRHRIFFMLNLSEKLNVGAANSLEGVLRRVLHSPSMNIRRHEHRPTRKFFGFIVVQRYFRLRSQTFLVSTEVNGLKLPVDFCGKASVNNRIMSIRQHL